MSAPQLTQFEPGSPSAAISADQLNTLIQSCDNFTQLRAFVGVPGICVFARGQTTAGDGQQGTFYWATGQVFTDDNVNTIVPPAAFKGAWKRLTASVLPTSTYLQAANNLTDLANTGLALQNLFNGVTSLSLNKIIGTQNLATVTAQGAFDVGTLSFTDSGVTESLQGSLNGYVQAIVQNTNSGALASADFIVANNLGTSGSYYGDFGINSSGFSGNGSLNIANATYVYAAGGDLVLGTTGSNAIHFVVNSGVTDAMTISAAGVVSLANALAISSGGTGATSASSALVNIGAATAIIHPGAYSTLALADAAAVTAGKPLQLLAGTYTIAANQTLSSVLWPMPGAILQPAVGVTLTISGGVYPVFTKWLDNSNAGTIQFTDGVVPEIQAAWFGFSASATYTANDNARKWARDSITTRGVVRFPPGSFSVSAYVPINRSYIKFVGASQFGTTFVPTSGSGDCTGIDGTLQPGYVFNTSALINYCEHLDISVLRADSQTAVGITGIPTGSRGFVHQYAANSKVDALLGNSPIDYYQKWTSGCRVRLDTSRNPLSGDGSSTVRYGFVSDCSLAPPTNVGLNDDNQSCYRWHRDYINPAFVGTNSWGALDYGDYMTDHFIEMVETSGALHAWDVLCPDGSATLWDYHVTRCVLDGWGASSGVGSGLRLAGFPAGSCFTILDGYSTPGFANASLLPSVWISACTGVVIGEGFEAKGGVNYANHVCYQLTSVSDRCKIRGRATGFSTGCLINGGSFLNIVSIDCMTQSGQTAAQAVSIAGASTNRNRIEGCLVDGAANYNYAFLIDTNAQYNTIGPNNVNPAAITTAVISVNGSSVTTTKSGSAWIDVVSNHNRVLPGTLDDGL